MMIAGFVHEICDSYGLWNTFPCLSVEKDKRLMSIPKFKKNAHISTAYWENKIIWFLFSLVSVAKRNAYFNLPYDKQTNTFEDWPVQYILFNVRQHEIK